MPANEIKRLDLRFRAVMAGNGFRVNECRESIMQFERFNARRAVNDARESGICAKRFDERSREFRVLASGTKPVAEMVVRELSARLRCLRNRHFVDGRMPIDSKVELLPRGLYHVSDVLE
jgi:hypothetical protein